MRLLSLVSGTWGMIPVNHSRDCSHWESIRGQGEYWNPRININGTWTEYGDSTYLGDLLTDHAIKFIRKQKQNDKPFFVYLSHKGVHDPFQAPKRYEGCYKNCEVPMSSSLTIHIMALLQLLIRIHVLESLYLVRHIMEI